MNFPYDSGYFPPAPILEIHLAAPESAFSIGPLRAFVDSGADVSIIPTHLIEPLGLQVDNRKYLKNAWGERRLVDVYLLDVGVGTEKFPLAEIIADDRGEQTILGRNILNKLALMLDGPRLMLELHAR